jgi:hypothetical protein
VTWAVLGPRGGRPGPRPKGRDHQRDRHTTGPESPRGQPGSASAPIVLIGSGRRTGGLVGRELLERYVVAFDYDARVLTAYEPFRFEYRGKGAILPIEIGMGGPVFRATLRMPDRPPLPMRLLLDAPHAGPLVLTTPFVDRHALVDSARTPCGSEAVSGWPVRGC